jgi:short-subunit dehydrogenase
MPETALITGASGGLGEQFATLFAKDGTNLVVVARSVERLERLKEELEHAYGITVTVLPADLSQAEGVDALVRVLEERNVLIDILVNNAGFGQFGLLQEIPLAKHREMIRLNVEALTVLTRYLLPGMLARKRGRILNVASTAAFQPGPLMAVYFATKAYVLSFSMALSEELRGTGVTVTCLCPGPTRTGFQEHAAMARSRLFRGRTQDALSVARTGYDALRKGRRLVIAGLRNRLLAFLTRFLPIRTAAWFAGKAQEPV